VKRAEMAALAGGLGLVLLAVFVATSLLTWDVRDPQVLANYEGSPAPIRNRCGWGGALVSSFLFRAHGAAACVVPAALAGLGCFMIARRSASGCLRRAAGAGVLVLGLSLLAGTCGDGWLARLLATRSVEGPGGTFGAIPVAALTRLLGGVGAYLAIFFVLCAGVILVSREAAEKALEALGRAVVRSAPALAQSVRSAAEGLFRRRGRRPEERAFGGMPSGAPAPAASPAAAAAPSGKACGVASDAAAAATQGARPSPSRSLRQAAKDVPPSEATTRRMRPKGSGYELPPAELLIEEDTKRQVNREELAQRGAAIRDTLADFDIETRLVGFEPGPAVTLYEFELASVVKLSRVVALRDNIAMAVMSPSVRVIAPLPGKSTIGVEVANLRTEVVRMRPLLESEELGAQEMAIPLLLGRDATGRPLVADLAVMPHLLVAGASGSGKSVCLHSIISSILVLRRPDEVQLALVDPKTVEFTRYDGIPHLVSPVVTEVKRASGVLDWAVQEMENRYKVLGAVGVRDIGAYNKLSRDERMKLAGEAAEAARLQHPMPHLVIVVDELADLMMVTAKEVQFSVTRLAQKSRATGIHLVLATQRPSVDVITGVIKTNISYRVAFQVSSRVDSQIILDQNGAEKLLGRGDMLYLSPGCATPVRAKGVYLSDEEIARVVEHVRAQAAQDATGAAKAPAEKGATLALVPPPGSRVFEDDRSADRGDADTGPAESDELYEEAVRLVLSAERGSVSLLQRQLGVGYGRAGRLIDRMAAEGLLGPYRGSKFREVTTTLEEWEQRRRSAAGNQLKKSA